MTQESKNQEKNKKSYHHGDLRSALVVSATELLAEEGVEKLSLRGVARKAGVSQAAPYYHFRNKHSLLSAVAAGGFERLSETMAAYATRYEDPFQGIGVGYVTFALENPALFRLMEGPYFTGDNTPDDLSGTARDSLRMLLEGVAEQMPGASDRDVALKAAGAWSVVHGLATLLLDGRLQGLFEEPIDVETLASAVTGQLSV